MTREPPVAGQRVYLAAGILVACWVTFVLLVWLIVAVDPVVIPIWFIVPGFLVALLFGLGLIASKRWARVWRHTFTPTLPLPPWVWTGALTTAVTVVVLSIFQPISTQSVLWLGLMCTAGSYVLLIGAQKEWLRGLAAWPWWIALLLVIVVATLLGLSLFLEANAILSVVFFTALLLFAFHVWFILPLTLYEARGSVSDWEPQSYPLLSVLIPAYNEEGVIGDCLESVLETTYPHDRLEIVVIDDGSEDGTYAEAAGYRDKGVKVFRRSNGGKHAALNYGLECSTGDVVVTVDADSRPDPGAIPAMVGQLQSDPGIGALSAPVLAINDDSLIARLQRLEYALSNTIRRAYSVFEAVPVVPGCLGVYRREALENVWGYDPDTVAEDFDVTVKLLKDGWTVRHGTGVVWTIVPTTWHGLWRQRLRWYQGGLETIRKHWRVLVNPRYDYLHAFSLPARLVSHALGPPLSFIIIIAVIWGFVTAPSLYLVSLVVLFFLLTALVTLYSVVLEDEPLHELALAPLFFVGYKHFIDLSLAVGNVRAYVSRRRW